MSGGGKSWTGGQFNRAQRQHGQSFFSLIFSADARSEQGQITQRRSAMSLSLNGKRVALLVTDGFEQVEMTEPKKALEQAGARAEILSAEPGEVRGWHHDKPGDSFAVDGTFDTAQVEEYDALVLPGGVMNSDTIRTNDAARTLVQAAEKAGKPIAVICHGAWLLVSAGLVKGKTLTSWPSLRDDIRNAGGNWQDMEVVRDGNLISSRKPDDLPAFNRALLETLAA